MPPSSRKTPGGFRHRASTTPKHHMRWKLWLGILVSLVVLGAFGWLLTRQPRGYECLTDLNTFCPAEIEAALAPLGETPLWRLESRKAQILEQAKTDPRFISAEISLSPLQIIKAKVQLAQPLFPFTAEGQNWQLLSNSQAQPTGETAFPNIEFGSVAQAKALTQAEKDELTKLYQRLRSFSPRVRKILVLTSTEVEVYPENTGKVLFTLANVERQLATLQAFFRSTTIHQTYQVLDVRFSEVAVIKE